MAKEAIVDYSEKLRNFQTTINAYPELLSFYRTTDQDGYNDHNDRYWTAVFHKISQADPTLDKSTRLSFGAGKISQSKIFLFDHQSKHSLVFNVDKRCLFARYLEAQNMLVYQTGKEIGLVKIVAMNAHHILTITDKNFYIKNIIPEQSGLGYLAFLGADNSPGLIKYCFENETINHIPLLGYMTRFGILHELAVHEKGGQAVVAVLGVGAQQKSDPDMGYSVFINNGENDDHLYNFQNVWFQNWTPRKFEFRANKMTNKVGLIASENQQSFVSYVPTNLK